MVSKLSRMYWKLEEWDREGYFIKILFIFFGFIGRVIRYFINKIYMYAYICIRIYIFLVKIVF